MKFLHNSENCRVYLKKQHTYPDFKSYKFTGLWRTNNVDDSIEFEIEFDEHRTYKKKVFFCFYEEIESIVTIKKWINDFYFVVAPPAPVYTINKC